MKKTLPINSTILRRFSLIFFLIVAFTSILSWWLVSDTWGHYTYARNSLEQFEEYYHVLVVSNRLVDERGYANELIFTTPGRSWTVFERLKHSQALTDDSFNQLPERLKNSQSVADTQATLNKGREAIARCAFRACKDQQSTANAIAMMMNATNYYHKAIFLKTNDFIQMEPKALAGILRTQALGELRDLTGKLGSVVLLPLFSGRPLTLDEQFLINTLLTRIEMQWQSVNIHADDIAIPYIFDKHLMTTHHHFKNQGLALIHYVQEASRNDGKYDLTVDSFATRYHYSLRTFNDLFDLYIYGLKKSYLSKKREALTHLILTLLTLVIVYALALTSIIYVRTRILKPLWLLNKKARAITEQARPTDTGHAATGCEIKTLQETIDTLETNFDEQVAQSEHLRLKAEQDELTTVLNRRGFEEAARVVINKACIDSPAWLVLLDIDFFKSINDTWGHPVGDQVLAVLGYELKQSVRVDDVVARIGGEEFAVMFREGDNKQVSVRVKALQKACRRVRVTLEDQTAIHITASFGVSSAWHGSLVAMSAEADRALYTAKRNGRNRVEGLPG
ncbi:MAG TPA: GGDEF domain-containing protein [Scandinavium sp.]|jgi:diguanylate cyclase (GGDEF)-like protein